MKSGIAVVILAFVVATARCQTSRPKPLVAFGSGESVVLVSKAGEVVSTIKLPVKVGEFAFSPDLKKLVVVSTFPPDESGGKMYLYTVESKQIQPIPAQAMLPSSAKSEVYSDPQFSPDGTKLLFLVHPQAEGDLYETSGPIAELDLKSLRARELHSNAGDDTDGAMLSPNGREVLLWDPAMVIDTKGTTLLDFHDNQLGGNSFEWARNVAWIGNNCVLYEAGKSTTPRIKGEISYFVLQLKSLKSASASTIIGLSDKELGGVVSYRYPYAVVKSTQDSAGNRGLEYFLVSSGGTHTKVAPGDATVVQVLPNNLVNDLPAECR